MTRKALLHEAMVSSRLVYQHVSQALSTTAQNEPDRHTLLVFLAFSEALSAELSRMWDRLPYDPPDPKRLVV